MPSQAPAFWWHADWRAVALSPLAALYATVARHRLVAAPRVRIGLPVLCVGNFTVGGSGKTPVAIALARAAAGMGLKPGIVSRGHGGTLRTTRLVDPRKDTADVVGDEPLLLARHAPVAVSADRAAGADLLARQGCDLVVMDDGFQSARIHMDYALLVVDAARGTGNGRVLPAGPLRARIVDQLGYADAVLRVGSGTGADAVVRAASRAGRPVFQARLVPSDASRFAGRRVLAFAGIGHPEKFFETLRAVGAEIALARPFPDHHVYREEEVRELLSTARAQHLALVTTAKDAARLGQGLQVSSLWQSLQVLEVDAVFEPAEAARRIIDETLRAWRKRRAAG